MRLKLGVMVAVVLMVSLGQAGYGGDSPGGTGEVYKLDQVVITATKTEKRVDEIPASVEVVPRP
jgi:outer membrane cobalamin receptor